jgi:hypothetical protein
MTETPIDLEALKQQITHGYMDFRGGDNSEEEMKLLALIEVAEAAQEAINAIVWANTPEHERLTAALSKFTRTETP